MSLPPPPCLFAPVSPGPSSPLPAGVASLLYSAMSPASHPNFISHSAAAGNHWLCGLLLSGRPWSEPSSALARLCLHVPGFAKRTRHILHCGIPLHLHIDRTPTSRRGCKTPEGGSFCSHPEWLLGAILLWDNTLDHSLFLASHWLIEDISSPCGSAIQRLPFCVFAGMRDRSI